MTRETDSQVKTFDTRSLGDDPVTRMFAFWNGAFRDAGFTAEAFARHFTDDAQLIVNGQQRALGPAEIARHFEAIRQGADSAEVALPLLRCLAKGDEMFVHYRVDASVAGIPEAEEAMAHVQLSAGRIARMEIISRPLG